jgi:hypothetical protein
MSSPQLRTLTAREQRASELLRRIPADLVLGVVAAALGAFARVLVNAYCSQPGGAPEGGTDGASYCRSVAGLPSWTAYVAAAIGIALIARLLFKRVGHSRVIALAVVLVALVANTIVVFSLPDVGP